MCSAEASTRLAKPRAREPAEPTIAHSVDSLSIGGLAQCGWTRPVWVDSRWSHLGTRTHTVHVVALERIRVACCLVNPQVRVARTGYPIRLQFQVFIADFQLLLKKLPKVRAQDLAALESSLQIRRLRPASPSPSSVRKRCLFFVKRSATI
eukprot:6207896-Pleurochrysis_carterae.AAC.2